MALIDVYKKGVVVAKAAVPADIAREHGKYHWTLMPKGYVRRTTRGADGVCRTIYLHRLVVGAKDPLLHVDHLDGDKLNNMRSNLEVITNEVNSRRMHSRRRGITYIDQANNAPAPKEKSSVEAYKKPAWLED